MHIFGLAFILNFSLKWQSSFFGPNSTGKGIFDLNKKNWTLLLNSAYSN